MIDGKRNNIFLTIIGVLSVLIPIVVAILLFKPSAFTSGLDVSFLPHLNAVFNTATAVSLGVGFYFIKTGNISMHKVMMIIAFALSSLFLVSYVIYHANAESTKFAGVGAIRYVYFFLLLSHILLAIVIVYFALRSLYFGLTKQYEKHKKVSKWTFPIWMYVAVSGVVVYLMISPYYK
jgi:putative membrane protein